MTIPGTANPDTGKMNHKIVTVTSPGTDVEPAIMVTVKSVAVPGVGTTEFEG